MFDALNIKALIAPVPGDFGFLLGVKPNEFPSSRLNKIMQSVKIGKSLVRSGQEFGIQFLQCAQVLVIKSKFLSVEAVLRVNAFINFAMELIDVLVFALMRVKLVLYTRQIGAIARFLQLLQFVLAPIDAVVQIAEVWIRINETGLVNGRAMFRDDSFLDRERYSRQWLDQTLVQKRAQRYPTLMQFLYSGK